ETIALLLETMSANHFNFGLTLPQGTHRIEVQAKIDTSLNTQTGSAAANATIGKGSLTIEEVNLIPSGYTVNF
ncbi:MAG TPA: hypothetical protein VM598_07485, partial [Bdellovibrionota bacterium]|nr:hypothetical protein [Bdellovibrionota bacterium]